MFDRHVLAFDMARFGETAAECIQERPTRSDRLRAQKPPHRHRWLLRARREFGSRRASERRSQHLPKAVGRRDAADLPLAGVDCVIRAALVDPGA
jgi:hypothetical protein